MSSLVIELQALASDPEIRISDILRKALVVATKLKLPDMRKWIEAELDGYDTEVPKYRTVGGAVTAHDPRSGLLPVLFANDPEMADMLSTLPLKTAVSELEDLVERSRSGSKNIVLTLPDGIIQIFNNHFGTSLPYYFEVQASTFVGVLDAVRTAVLKWALMLEEKGITGEGLSFTSGEQQLAQRDPSVHIEQFSGVFGDVKATSVQIGDSNSMYLALEGQGVPPEELSRLREIVDALPSAQGEERTSLLARGMQWVGNNITTIGSLATAVIKTWFSG